MRKKIKLPEDNPDNELPLRIAAMHIFTQIYEKTKSIQSAAIELVDISHGISVKIIKERDIYDTVDGFELIECITDYLHEAYDVVDRVPIPSAISYVQKVVATFPQEPLPADYKLDTFYHMQSDRVHSSIGTLLILQGASDISDKILSPLNEMFSDDFFMDHKAHARSAASSDPSTQIRGLQVEHRERRYKLTSNAKVSPKKAKASELLESLIDILDDDS